MPFILPEPACASTPGYQLTLSAGSYHLTGRANRAALRAEVQDHLGYRDSTNTSLLACRDTAAWLQSHGEASCLNAKTRSAALSTVLRSTQPVCVCICWDTLLNTELSCRTLQYLFFFYVVSFVWGLVSVIVSAVLCTHWLGFHFSE